MEDWQVADDAFNRSMDEAPPEMAVRDDWAFRHEILDISGHDHGYFNFEGSSMPLGMGLVDDGRSAGFPYYAFEEPWVTGCMEMQKLGFTATQILEAHARTCSCGGKGSDG